MQPLISVIIPTYNQAAFIAEAIESVRAQDYPQHRIEIIVVDDGSTDGTGDIVSRLGGGIKYCYQENAGKAAATALGMRAAGGEIIFNLDPDDEFLPSKVRGVVDVFMKYPSVAHVGHPVIYYYPGEGRRRVEVIPANMLGTVMSGPDLLRCFLSSNRFYGGGSSFAARSDILGRIHIHRDIGFTIDAYMVYFMLTRGDSYYLREPLSLYRVHEGAYSRRDPEERALIDHLANKAIYKEIKDSGADPAIKELLGFRSTMSELRLLESQGNKRFTDVFRMWQKVFNVSGRAGISPAKLAGSYDVLKRSLPVSLISLMRKIKGRVKSA